jgi:hypothetical protein
MKELFVYVVAIFILLYLSFVALQTLKTYSPNVYEGIENATAAAAKATATGASTEPMPVTGVGAASQLYGQTVTTAISAMETELGMDAYSEQYLSILENLKILYTQRAMKAALQTPTQKDNTNNLIPLYLYGQNIDTLDMLLQYVRSNKKSKW